MHKNFMLKQTWGYFVAKGTLDRLYLSKFWSNVHQIYSVRHTTTHTVLSNQKLGSLPLKFCFKKPSGKSDCTQHSAPTWKLAVPFFRYQQPVLNYHVDTG